MKIQTQVYLKIHIKTLHIFHINICVFLIIYTYIKTLHIFHVHICGLAEPEYDFVKPLKDMDTREKEACEFECEVNDADARVTWYREDKVTNLSYTEAMIVGERFLLEIVGQQ